MRATRAIGLSLMIAAGIGGAAGAQGPKPKPPQDAFTVLDRDGDGKVSREELGGLLQQADADKDGFISRDEAARFHAQGGEKRPAADRGKEPRPFKDEVLGRFTALDRDGNGRVGRDEFQGDAALFDRLDADKDGSITREEAVQFAAREAPGANPQQAAMEKFRTLDRDNDGTVSRDEFQGDQALFDRLDANTDGLITKDEVAQHLRREAKGGAAEGEKPGPARVLEKLRAMDENGDGKVSLAEFDGPEDLFGKLDADKDGSITQDEGAQFARLASEPAGPQGVVGKLRAMDRDGNGQISRDEFQGAAPLFDRIDANQDGSITKDEAVRFAEASQGQKAPGAGDGGVKPKPTKPPGAGDGGVKPRPTKPDTSL